MPDIFEDYHCGKCGNDYEDFKGTKISVCPRCFSKDLTHPKSENAPVKKTKPEATPRSTEKVEEKIEIGALGKLPPPPEAPIKINEKPVGETVEEQTVVEEVAEETPLESVAEEQVTEEVVEEAPTEEIIEEQPTEDPVEEPTKKKIQPEKTNEPVIHVWLMPTETCERFCVDCEEVFGVEEMKEERGRLLRRVMCKAERCVKVH